MATLRFFSPPDGAFVSNPELKWLENLSFKEGSDFWNAGAGQASLKRQDGTREVELVLTLCEPLGFYAEYIDVDSVYYVPSNDQKLDDTIVAYVGGDPLLIQKACLISRALTWAAVVEFCTTGERTAEVKWRRRSNM